MRGRSRQQFVRTVVSRSDLLSLDALGALGQNLRCYFDACDPEVDTTGIVVSLKCWSANKDGSPCQNDATHSLLCNVHQGKGMAHVGRIYRTIFLIGPDEKEAILDQDPDAEDDDDVFADIETLLEDAERTGIISSNHFHDAFDNTAVEPVLVPVTRRSRSMERKRVVFAPQPATSFIPPSVSHQVQVPSSAYQSADNDNNIAATCGDFGGLNKDNTRCKKHSPDGSQDGKCHLHSSYKIGPKVKPAPDQPKMMCGHFGGKTKAGEFCHIPGNQRCIHHR